MSYRKEFISKVKRLFADETEAYRRREEAQNCINDYFDILLEELFDEIEAVNKQLDIDYESIKLKGTELLIEYGTRSIEFFTRKSAGEKTTLDLLEDYGTGYRSKKSGKELSDALLDDYLKTVFAEKLK